MAKISGTYVVERKENLCCYLTALGLKNERLKSALMANNVLEIAVSGNECTITSSLGTRNFPLDKEIIEKFPENNVLKSITSLSGNKLSIISVGQDGKRLQRLYEASDSGLVLTLSKEGVGSAKTFFRRV